MGKSIHSQKLVEPGGSKCVLHQFECSHSIPTEHKLKATAHPKVITWIREFLVIYSMNLTIITFNYLGLCAKCGPHIYNALKYPPTIGDVQRLCDKIVYAVHNWIWANIFRCTRLCH